MPAGYGSVKRGPTEEFQASFDSIKPYFLLVVCCTVLPLLLFGVVTASLSATVKATCPTHLRSVFIGLGLLYIGVGIIGGCCFKCMGNKLVDIFKYFFTTVSYAAQDRDEEAEKQHQEMQSSAAAICLLGCPFVCILSLAFGTIMGFWIWGIVAAASAHHGACGAGPVVFWVLLSTALLTPCVGRCLVTVSVAA
mmetsp:Transcript_104858/g.326975  ORF Transcript_104858/g.326975 Transcript_104858/m.326975 type:complete len:194 (-) Transcript_104858:25-606(-)